MIRPCQAEDVDAIKQIGNRAWQPIYDMYAETFGDPALVDVKLVFFGIADNLQVLGAKQHWHLDSEPSLYF